MSQLFSNREILSHRLEHIAESLFEAIGLDLRWFMVNDREIRGAAPCHDDSDNKTGFVYYYDSGLWFCYTHQCHKKFGPDLLGLIRACKKYNYHQAASFAEEFLQGKNIKVDSIPLRKAMRIIQETDPWREHCGQKEFSETWLQKLSSPVAYCRQRELSYELVRILGGGVAGAGFLSGRFVLPIRNIESKIVGFTGRKINDNNPVPKWIHYPEDFEKNCNLYNIDRAYQTINGNKTIIVVEGPIDVIKLEMAGFPNVVALLGCSINDAQIALLAKMNVVQVYVALDNDEPGRKATENMGLKLSRSLFDNSIVVPAAGKKDWGECTIEEIQNSFEKYNIF